MSDKIDFKTKTITTDRERHYIMNMESTQEDITIVNIYAPNIGAPKYIQQILTDIKEKLTVTIIFRTFTPHLHQWTDHPDRKSIRNHWP